MWRAYRETATATLTSAASSRIAMKGPLGMLSLRRSDPSTATRRRARRRTSPRSWCGRAALVAALDHTDQQQPRPASARVIPAASSCRRPSSASRTWTIAPPNSMPNPTRCRNRRIFSTASTQLPLMRSWYSGDRAMRSFTNPHRGVYVASGVPDLVECGADELRGAAAAALARVGLRVQGDHRVSRWMDIRQVSDRSAVGRRSRTSTSGTLSTISIMGPSWPIWALGQQRDPHNALSARHSRRALGGPRVSSWRLRELEFAEDGRTWVSTVLIEMNGSGPPPCRRSPGRSAASPRARGPRAGRARRRPRPARRRRPEGVEHEAGSRGKNTA